MPGWPGRSRRRRTRHADQTAPWLAIAAAGTLSSSGRRRSRRAPWLTGAVTVVVLVAGAAYAVHRADGSAGNGGARLRRASAPADPGRHRTAPPSHARHHPAPAAKASDPFTAALRAWLAGRQGDITAAVEDLPSGREWLYRPGIPEHTASIVKVDILATLLHQDQRDGGPSAADRQLAAQMIENSDDDDATDLWNAVGGAPAVQAFDDAVGMHQTSANVAWGETSTTPLDQLKLLRTVLLKNSLLDRASRDYADELMRNISAFDTWGVTAGPGGHATVAFKNGWLPDPDLWQVNSIGSVDGDGRHYLIAVMTRDNPSEGYGIQTIEQISRTAWEDLDVPAR